ncbi:MAG: chain-length determining protein [Bacteroidaceae bacterium]|nr:chain-length determining protein [Bacteroidaceae bacterium]
MEQSNNQQQVIDLTKIFKTIWGKRRTFFKVWIVTFILSCIWVFPKPRFYTCEVKLAPEMGGDQGMGGFSGIASSFGFNMGGAKGQDAIYPELYPQLFENPEFIVGLYDVLVTTKDGDISTNYFTYIKKHQKKNALTRPYYYVVGLIKSMFAEEDNTPRVTSAKGVNPFMMNRKDYDLMRSIMGKIKCSVDKKTSVITINVKDQDPLVCAIMADSAKQHLQNFIIQYRTSKAHEDVAYFQHMRDSAEYEYYTAMERYSRYCDSHRGLILQSYQSMQDKLQNELSLKQNALSAMETQLQNSMLKLQEKTPAFTTLMSAVVPVRPAGPKRLMFVIMMLILASIGTAVWLCKDEIFNLKEK